ncbi:hypothetical protein ONZ45_g14888 [Pleurotus djamor]|nr:hypothetical protein ONZ45_g14888 [Pleurotus djamor]
MPAVRTRLFGWTPSSVNDSNVEVITPQRPFVPSPPLSTLPLLADPIPTFPPQTISLPRAIGTPKEHTHDAPSSPMSTSPNLATRSGSPEHIRRPRNSFIIFRCQFAREHSKSKSEDAADMASEKSMSARASEAWHQLSAEEKKVYDDLALLEKAEHARKNPDYRYRLP